MYLQNIVLQEERLRQAQLRSEELERRKRYSGPDLGYAPQREPSARGEQQSPTLPLVGRLIEHVAERDALIGARSSPATPEHAKDDAH